MRSFAAAHTHNRRAAAPPLESFLSSSATATSSSPSTYAARLSSRRDAVAAEEKRAAAVASASAALSCPRLSTLFAHAPGLFSGDAVKASSRLLRCLDPLPRVAAERARSLFFSHNLIVSLAGIEQFRGARTISLAANEIASWAEVARLRALPRLAHIAFTDNPIARTPFYRARLIVGLVDGARLPLETVDGARVDAGEVEESRAALRIYDAALAGLLASEWRIWGLAGAVKRFALHEELALAAWGGAARAPRGAAAAGAPPPAPSRPDVGRIMALWTAQYSQSAGASMIDFSDNEIAFEDALTKVLVKEIEVKATAYVRVAPAAAASALAPRAEAARWASAFSILSSVQASVAAELCLLADSGAEACAGVRSRIAARDAGGRISAAVDAEAAARTDQAQRVTRTHLASTTESVKNFRQLASIDGLSVDNGSEASEARFQEAVTRVAGRVAETGFLGSAAVSSAPPLSALGRLVKVVSRGGGNPAPAPTGTPVPAPTQTAGTDIDTIATFSDADLAKELEGLDAPALRVLVSGLAIKLKRFAEANTHNAALAAERITAAQVVVDSMSARVIAAESARADAEREAEAARRAAREATAAAQHATAVVSAEAEELKGHLAQLHERVSAQNNN